VSRGIRRIVDLSGQAALRNKDYGAE